MGGGGGRGGKARFIANLSRFVNGEINVLSGSFSFALPSLVFLYIFAAAAGRICSSEVVPSLLIKIVDYSEHY